MEKDVHEKDVQNKGLKLWIRVIQVFIIKYLRSTRDYIICSVNMYADA